MDYEKILNFLLGPFLIWLPVVFFALIFVIAIFFYIRKKEYLLKRLKLLIILSVCFDIFYASIKTLDQYYVWSSHEFTKILLNQSLDQSVPMFGWLRSIIFSNKFGYFLFYSWGRFWLSVAVIFICALVFWWFLKLIEKYYVNLAKEELLLGPLIVLAVGWPRFVIFLPSLLVFAVIVSIYRQLRFRGTDKIYVDLVWPMILAGLFTLILGNWLIKIIGLDVLVV